MTINIGSGYFCPKCFQHTNKTQDAYSRCKCEIEEILKKPVEERTLEEHVAVGRCLGSTRKYLKTMGEFK